MNRAAPRSTTASVLAGAALCALMAATVIVTTALLIIATGRAAEMRHALGFGFGGVDRSLAEVAWIAAHNARVVGATLACAAAAPRLPRRIRQLVDAVLAIVLSLSAGAVGAAYGAYGGGAITATAPHLPVEFAGLSLAGGGYVHARIHAIRATELAAIALACGGFLVAAALLETYVFLGGGTG